MNVPDLIAKEMRGCGADLGRRLADEVVMMNAVGDPRVPAIVDRRAADLRALLQGHVDADFVEREVTEMLAAFWTRIDEVMTANQGEGGRA